MRDVTSTAARHKNFCAELFRPIQHDNTRRSIANAFTDGFGCKNGRG
jgi:hypothetical protein